MKGDEEREKRGEEGDRGYLPIFAMRCCTFFWLCSLISDASFLSGIMMIST